MPKQLKDHILKIWTKNCKGKGEEKEAKYDYKKYFFSCDSDLTTSTISLYVYVSVINPKTPF